MPYAPEWLSRIPGPRALPLLGNAFDIDRADPLGGFVRMAQEYGPIFKIATPGGMRLLVSGPELVDEVCRMAMDARKRDPLRTGAEDDEGAP